MKTKIEEEAILAHVRCYELLCDLRNSIVLAKAYRNLARNFMEAWEGVHGPAPDWHGLLGKVDDLLPAVGVTLGSQALPSEAAEVLSTLKSLAEHDLAEDELARLLKALREDGFKWQPPHAV